MLRVTWSTLNNVPAWKWGLRKGYWCLLFTGVHCFFTQNKVYILHSTCVQFHSTPYSVLFLGQFNVCIFTPNWCRSYTSICVRCKITLQQVYVLHAIVCCFWDNDLLIILCRIYTSFFAVQCGDPTAPAINQQLQLTKIILWTFLFLVVMMVGIVLQF